MESIIRMIVDYLRENLGTAWTFLKTLITPEYVRSCLRNGITWMVTGYFFRYVRSLFRRKKDGASKTVRLAPADSGRSSESMVHGSTPVLMAHREGEVIVFARNKQGVDLHIGKGCRINDYLVIPEHVMSDAQSLGELGVLNALKPGHVILVKDEFKVCLPDIVYVRLCNDDWSKLGTSIVTISRVARSQDASITGIDGKGTLGRLTLTKDIGTLNYDATTQPGYSGALYASGRQAIGMHLSGGVTNSGTAVGLIWAVIKYYEKPNLESSEDWAWEIIKDGIPAGLKVEAFGEDATRILYNGRYHIVEDDVLRKAWGNKYHTILYGDDAPQYESVFRRGRSSGDLPEAPKPGKSSTPPAVFGLIQPLKTQYSALSKEAKVAFRKHLSVYTDE